MKRYYKFSHPGNFGNFPIFPIVVDLRLRKLGYSKLFYDTFQMAAFLNIKIQSKLFKIEKQK